MSSQRYSLVLLSWNGKLEVERIWVCKWMVFVSCRGGRFCFQMEGSKFVGAEPHYRSTSPATAVIELRGAEEDYRQLINYESRSD